MSELVDLTERLLDYFGIASANDAFPPQIEVDDPDLETTAVGAIDDELFDLLKSLRAELDRLEE